MRVKHKKWADPLMAEHPELLVDDAAKFKGKWQSRFPKKQPNTCDHYQQHFNNNYPIQ